MNTCPRSACPAIALVSLSLLCFDLQRDGPTHLSVKVGGVSTELSVLN